MGLAEVQRVLALISIDRALRERFFADPATIGAELGLATGEAAGMARIPRRQIEQFADSLRRKRRDQVRRVVPITARALGRKFAGLFDRYLDSSPPRGSKADLADAAGLVAAMGRWADQIDPPWAVDLARYELAWREAARAGRFPIMRIFRFPVARIATRCEPDSAAPRLTLACWWRPVGRGSVRHIVMTMPKTPH